MPRAFIVYSSASHVSYIDDVLQIIESVLVSLNIEPFRLNNVIQGNRIYPQVLQNMINESDMGIVVLDGLRPNVTFEYGLLMMKNINIVPFKRIGAKFAIKSAFYNPTKNVIDPSLAFGDTRYKKAAFSNLQDPLLDINIHFSDCQGRHIVPYNTIDDTQEENSLGKQLRNEIKDLIPQLRSREGPNLDRIRILFADLDNINLLEESLRLLSLFSFLGWGQDYEDDTRFQPIRENFLALFQNKNATVENINEIFEALLESEVPILRNYGRYITVDSDRLITESFQYMLEHGELFNTYFVAIMQSEESQLKTRFIDRLSSNNSINSQFVIDIGIYIFNRSGLFPDISVIQDKLRCQLFAHSAKINPSGAMGLLETWINPLSPKEIAELFPFRSSLMSPGNPQDKVLWFLSAIAKLEAYFTSAMNILHKFTIPIIVNEASLQKQIHYSTGKIALQVFIEQCHSLIGNVNVTTRWQFIRNLNWDEEWPEEYKEASKILKFRAIKTFLEKQWTVTGGVRNGSVQIQHYNIPDGRNYDELETSRKEAYKIIMNWCADPNDYSGILQNVYNYLIHEMSEWVKYINWEEIKSFLNWMFSFNVNFKSKFRVHVQNIRNYSEWQSSYSDESLELIYQFDDILKVELSNIEFFRWYLGFTPYNMRLRRGIKDRNDQIKAFNQIQLDLITRFNSLSKYDLIEIKNLLISENLAQSFEFGMCFRENFTLKTLIEKIEFYSTLIVDQSIISDFFLGLVAGLHQVDENSWERTIDIIWKNVTFKLYRPNLLWVGRNVTSFKWGRYQDLLNLDQIDPIKMLAVISNKEFSNAISITEIRDSVILCIEKISELAVPDLGRYNLMSDDDKFSTCYLHIESIVKRIEGILNDQLARVYLERMVPHIAHLLSRLYNTDLLIQFGQLTPELFIPWLKQGFNKSELDGDKSFLIKSSSLFLPQIYEIIVHLFSLSENPENITLDHKIAIKFENSSDPNILLKLTDDQINNLYELNHRKLGHMYARILRNIAPENEFPSKIKQVIINHLDNLDFSNTIFSKFTSGVRSFSGNNYAQEYATDYARIINWREKSLNTQFRDWLARLHRYVDSISENSTRRWKEREIE